MKIKQDTVKNSKKFILFPGRHHLLTKFQGEYLRTLASNPAYDIEEIIFAITSANHDNTRRNPIPLYLRAIAIDEFASTLSCGFRMYPIPDLKPSGEFAKYLLTQIYYQCGRTLTPENTLIACSTPPIIALFEELKFEILPVELECLKPETYSALRPYEVINLLIAAGDAWRTDDNWRMYASEATQKLYDHYDLGDTIGEQFRDSLLGDDADITNTRNYGTYAQSMDGAMRLKFADIKPFVVQGKIVDVGCSTGSLIRLLAEEFTESDIVGIEAVRKFYEFCKMQEYASPYVFFYRRNITDQNFKENTINTFIYSSVLHEIYSYLGELTLERVLRNSWLQLDFGGRIIIRDVVGPADPDKEVYMELAQSDSAAEGVVGGLSTYARFFRFVEDFKPRRVLFTKECIGGKDFIKLRLQDAYEFISKKDYADNWLSEMHEEFGFYSFWRWQEKLAAAGFRVVAGSREFTNPHIVERHYAGKAALFTMEHGVLVPELYPPTNMVLVGEK